MVLLQLNYFLCCYVEDVAAAIATIVAAVVHAFAVTMLPLLSLQLAPILTLTTIACSLLVIAPGVDLGIILLCCLC